MNPQAYGYRTAPEQISKQEEDALNSLSIFFYVYSGFTVLIALILVGVAAIPTLLIAAAPTKPGEPDPAVIGGIMLLIFGSMALIFIGKAVVMVLAGRALKQRRSYMLVMVAACLACINIPIGAALGVFAIITLQKPSVKARFGYS